MNFKSVAPGPSISLFVKNILVFDAPENVQQTVLPFFADGYPGLMFQQTANGLYVSPHNKSMPVLFLYGQTIQPIKLHIDGPYRLIVFQLYPFVLESFFGVHPKSLNDACYDTTQIPACAIAAKELLETSQSQRRVVIMTALLQALFEATKESLDVMVRQALALIADRHGKVSIASLCTALHVTERTFERRFSKAVGILPKQFAQIVQFNQSLEQLTVKDYTHLTDIVYGNGYADQSHFIRVFKAFTGKTPRKFIDKKK